jgi:hypothetical protein
MMKKFKLLTIAALFGLSATTQAAILASPSIYGGGVQNIAFVIFSMRALHQLE